jgi:peptide-N4-(N-acetyl-beta-glucosaminyl)asparagine amidase
MSSGLADICLYGSADILQSSESDNMMLSVTPLETDKTGTAFLIPGIKASESYVLDLTFRIHKQEGHDGADGMAVALLCVPEEDLDAYRNASGQVKVLGDGGAGLGYTGLGTQQDFAIELDTYRRYVDFDCSNAVTYLAHPPFSVDRCNDPPTPHISLHQPPNSHHNYSKACTAPHTIPDIADGQVYGLKIQHEVHATSNKQVITTWLRESSSRQGTTGESQESAPLFLWQVTQPWSPSDAGEHRVFAFTASTGGLTQAVSRHVTKFWLGLDVLEAYYFAPA